MRIKLSPSRSECCEFRDSQPFHYCRIEQDHPYLFDIRKVWNNCDSPFATCLLASKLCENLSDFQFLHTTPLRMLQISQEIRLIWCILKHFFFPHSAFPFDFPTRFYSSHLSVLYISVALIASI